MNIKLLIILIISLSLWQKSAAELIYPGNLIEAQGRLSTAFGECTLQTKEGLDFILIGEFPLISSLQEYHLRGFYVLFTDGEDNFLHGLLSEEKHHAQLAKTLSWALPLRNDLQIANYSLEKLQTEFLKKYQQYTNLMDLYAAKSLADADKNRWQAFLRLQKEYRHWRELYTAWSEKALPELPDNINPDDYYIHICKKSYLLYLRQKTDQQIIHLFPIAYGKNPDGQTKKEAFDCRTPDTPTALRSVEKTPFYIAQVFDKPLNREMSGCPLGIASTLPEHNFWSRNGLKILIHGSPNFLFIGTKASNGCIRLLEKDSQVLYNFIRIGTPVIIE